MPLQYSWTSPSGELWPAPRSTYNTVPFESLPPLNVSDETETFSYLRPASSDNANNTGAPAPPNGANGTSNGTVNGNGNGTAHADDDDASGSEPSEPEFSPDDEGLTFRDQSPADALALIEQHQAALAPMDMALPPAFLAFMRDPSLGNAVPTCTACYLDVGTKLFKIPRAGPGARALRFLNDQQCCVLWLLLLEPGRGARVIEAYPEWKSDDEHEEDRSEGSHDEDDDVLYDDEEDDGETLDGAIRLRQPRICADSFAEFMKRFWLENTIWFGGVREYPENAELDGYVKACQRIVAERDAAAAQTSA